MAFYTRLHLIGTGLTGGVAGLFLADMATSCRVNTNEKANTGPDKVDDSKSGKWVLDSSDCFHTVTPVRYRFHDEGGRPTRFVHWRNVTGNTSIPKHMIFDPQITVDLALAGKILRQDRSQKSLVVKKTQLPELAIAPAPEDTASPEPIHAEPPF